MNKDNFKLFLIIRKNAYYNMIINGISDINKEN